jgi:hypothetical protein
MKSILEKNKESSSKRNQTILGIALVAVMFLSVLGYGFQDSDEEGSNGKIVEYNGIKFVESNGFWFVENYGGASFLFKYNPKQITKFSVHVNGIETYSGKPLYISSENDAASQEIVRNLNQISQRVQPACLEGRACENPSSPIKNCSENFIVIEKNEESSISQEENCVFIRGPENALLNITDDFLFNTLGI